MLIKIMLRAIVVFVMAGLVMNVTASFYTRNPESWVWYLDPQKQYTQILQPPAAQDVLHHLGLAMERAEADAILEPSDDHLAKVLELRAHILAQARRYADAYQRFLWSHPDQDFTLRVAQRSDALAETADLSKKYRDQALQHLSRVYALLYVFRSDCPYCHIFSKFLNRFQSQYDFQVLSFSLDGRGSSNYPHPIIDQNFLRQHGLHPQAVPALYLVRPESNQILTLGFGLMNLLDIKNRILSLTGYAQGRSTATLLGP